MFELTRARIVAEQEQMQEIVVMAECPWSSLFFVIVFGARADVTFAQVLRSLFWVEEKKKTCSAEWWTEAALSSFFVPIDDE